MDHVYLSNDDEQHNKNKSNRTDISNFKLTLWERRARMLVMSVQSESGEKKVVCASFKDY